MANPYQSLDAAVFAVGNWWSSGLDLLLLKRDYGILERPFNFIFAQESKSAGNGSSNTFSEIVMWFPDNIEDDDELGTLTTTIHFKMAYEVTVTNDVLYGWERTSGTGGTVTSAIDQAFGVFGAGFTYSADYNLVIDGVPQGEQHFRPKITSTDTTSTTVQFKRDWLDYRSGDCYVKVDLA